MGAEFISRVVLKLLRTFEHIQITSFAQCEQEKKYIKFCG